MANQVSCQGESCSRKFVKAQGHFVHGAWFCSPACADKDPEVLRIREMIARKERGEPDIDVDLDGDDDVDL